MNLQHLQFSQHKEVLFLNLSESVKIVINNAACVLVMFGRKQDLPFCWSELLVVLFSLIFLFLTSNMHTARAAIRRTIKARLNDTESPVTTPLAA